MSNDAQCVICGRRKKDAPLGGSILKWQRCPQCGAHYCGYCGRDVLEKRDIIPPRRGYCIKCGTPNEWF